MRRIRFLLLSVIVMLTVSTVLTGTVGAAPSGRLVYWAQVDVVRGHFDPTGPLCVQTSVFKQGEHIVWRAEVRDVATGREVGNDGKDVAEIDRRGISVVVHLENGMFLRMVYGQHPPRPREGEPVNYFWTAAWTIPMDYPTGTLRYWVIVRDKAGAFVRYDPIGVGTNLPPVRLIIEKR